MHNDRGEEIGGESGSVKGKRKERPCDRLLRILQHRI